MSRVEHPSTEALVEYLEAPQAPAWSALRLHLAGCADCRGRVDRLGAMAEDLQRWLPGQPPAEASDGESAARRRAELHYRLHASDMAGHLGAPPSPRGRWWSVVKAWLSQHPGPWLAVPAAFAAGLALALSLQLALAPGAKLPRVLSYQDQPGLSLVEPGGATPSLGFFAAARARQLPFDGLAVRTAGPTSLQLSWSAVPGATLYRVRLLGLSPGGQLAAVQTAATAARVELGRPLASGRYEWELSGETVDGAAFRAEGGFVVDRARP